MQKNPIVQQILNDSQGKILQREKENFIYRLSLINSWALIILDETNQQSRQVYDMLDDWVVDAVALENQINMQILSSLKEVINTEQIQIEEYQIQVPNLQLYSKIQTTQFSN